MADKVTYTMDRSSKDHKSVKRFETEVDGKNVNIYLPNKDVEKLDNPDKIKLTITAVE
jgi:hypothetical protein